MSEGTQETILSVQCFLVVRSSWDEVHFPVQCSINTAFTVFSNLRNKATQVRLFGLQRRGPGVDWFAVITTVVPL